MAKEASPQPTASANPPSTAPKRKRAGRRSDAEEVLGVRFLSRIDPDEDFSDVDGDPRNEFALNNEDPDRHYIWVAKDDVDVYRGHVVPHRLEHYEDKGDAVKPLMGVERTEAGETIAKRGTVLMSCDKAMWQKRNRYELSKQRQTNERMFKKRQRDTDLRNREAFEEEMAEVRA